MKKLNYIKTIDRITNWLKKYTSTSNTKGFVLGVSGGIDSAVVSTLCARTGLPVLILEMPIHQGSDQVTRSEKHIEWLKENFDNVESRKIDLTNVYEMFKGTNIRATDNNETFEFSLSNSRSRLRMVTLYQLAGQLGYLVAGTGNKVEDFGIGFYTKYGDGGVDISPIADLMKSEVYSLGRELGLIEEILNAAPTDGLHDDGRTDEDQIGASYDELEWAMEFVKENWFWETGMESSGYLRYEADDLSERENIVLEIYLKMHNNNKHKMTSIPICDVSDMYEDEVEELH